MKVIYYCFCVYDVIMGKRDSDMDDVIILIVNGLIKWSKNLINFVSFRNIWKRDVIIIEFDIWN